MFCITLMNNGILIYLNRNQNILNTAKSDLNLFPTKGGGGMPPPFVLTVKYICLDQPVGVRQNANRPVFCLSGYTNQFARSAQRNDPGQYPYCYF